MPHRQPLAASRRSSSVTAQAAEPRMGSYAAPTPTVAKNDEAFAAILALLHERTGTDFALYRVATVTRRVLNRMISVGASTFEQYLARLTADACEAQQLLRRVTIKVSRFYRNRAAFDALRHSVLPELARAAEGAPLRIWSAGCGCGEEAYTLAMLLVDAGIEGTVEATDIDDDALDYARRAHYPAAAVTELPDDLRVRHLTVAGHGFSVDASVRARVSFARHDLTAPGAADGAPFHLVSCRNVLIYFDRPIQEHAMRFLRNRVRPGGYLCLGEAEWPLPAVAETLVPLSRPSRVFRAGPFVPFWSKS